MTVLDLMHEEPEVPTLDIRAYEDPLTRGATYKVLDEDGRPVLQLVQLERPNVGFEVWPWLRNTVDRLGCVTYHADEESTADPKPWHFVPEPKSFEARLHNVTDCWDKTMPGALLGAYAATIEERAKESEEVPADVA